MTDNDYGGVEQFVELQRGDGSLRAYCGRPNFAGAGFVAIVPELYARFDEPRAAEDAWERTVAFLRERLLTDAG